MADKFISEEEDIDISQCAYCRHWDFIPGPYCEAFPQGVPKEILYNRVDHKKPYPGDNGIQFERRVK